MTTAWPKQLPSLTPEQQAVRDDFVRHWHEVLPRRYGAIERFNHRYPLRSLVRRDDRIVRTLEIGAGLGEHLEYEDLGSQDYTCLELRPDLVARLRERFPGITAIVGDCQEALPFDDGHFDRAIAVHVLEHLPNLPAALDQLRRVVRPGGLLGIVIPCDPGLAYGFARRISAKREFERRYGQPYEWFIRLEHLNSPREIVQLLDERFRRVHARYFPLRARLTTINLCLGLTVEVPGG